MLNVNNDCIYVLHPALTKSIDKLQRKKIKHFNLFVLGRGMSVPQDKLILTILSALAQDESRSISDNIRWSIQKKFQRGEAMVDLSRMLGYDKGENRSRENKWKALCGNYVGGVLGVPHGLLSGGVLLIKMFDKL